jgi:hydroxypyruvate reductase/glycerate 2-kinase
MPLIKNFQELATSPQRETVLQIIEAGLKSIQPEKVLKTSFILNGSSLTIQSTSLDLKNFNRVFLIGFGKGSAGISKIIEKTLGKYLTEGFVIDNNPQQFSKINFTLGTHPMPSEQNINFTKNVLDKISNLTEKDLVLVVICGGGSAMFEKPYQIDIQKLIQISELLIKSSAAISEINIIRKHLSKVKGGGFAKHLYPAAVSSLIFSDVLGNDLSTIASGPTVLDISTIDDAWRIIEKYEIQNKVDITKDDFIKLPKEEKYFKNVNNIIISSNKTALNAMKQKIKNLGLAVDLYSETIFGNAKEIGQQLIAAAKPGRVLLAGGETTLRVLGNGRGGRNQTLVLASLNYLDEKTIIASIASDGVDYYYFAGAIGDRETLEKAEKFQLDQNKFLSDDNSYEFFQKTGDGIYTDKLNSNVSDLMIVYKQNV